MTVNYCKTPFPWFGGKADAAPAVWEAFGDVPHYVEPFAGSLAVLLRRPHTCNRPYHSETVNDLDGLLVNAWRSIQLQPDATAEWASWPPSEVDLMSRHLWLLNWRAAGNVERLRAAPDWCDPRAAGYWIWGQSCWIGSDWCSGQGPWRVGADGRVERMAGRKEPGVKGERPHLSGDGQGVNHPQLRTEGVASKRPHLGNDGKGVNRPQLRAEGVASGTPDRPWLPEDFHPMTMPELRAWMAFLAARLRHVRIICGDWTRAVTTGAALTLPVRQGAGPAGIFLDPPYSAEADRSAGLYACEDLTVAHAVRAWCLERGDDPRWRIALAGFEGEHEELEAHGWRVVEWYKKGFLRGGMGNQRQADEDGKTNQQGRERIWLSPHCLRPDPDAQIGMGW